jgi:hypothetical protein
MKFAVIIILCLIAIGGLICAMMALEEDAIEEESNDKRGNHRKA